MGFFRNFSDFLPGKPSLEYGKLHPIAQMTCTECNKTFYLFDARRRINDEDQQVVAQGGNRQNKCPHCGANVKITREIIDTLP